MAGIEPVGVSTPFVRSMPLITKDRRDTALTSPWLDAREGRDELTHEAGDRVDR